MKMAAASLRSDVSFRLLITSAGALGSSCETHFHHQSSVFGLYLLTPCYVSIWLAPGF